MFFFELSAQQAPRFGSGLHAFERALDLLLEADPKMTISSAASLVHIARRLPSLYGGAISLSDVAKEMNLNYATFMRAADVLSEGGAKTRQLNLLESGIFPDNKRAKQFRLMPRGDELLRAIEQTIDQRNCKAVSENSGAV